MKKRTDILWTLLRISGMTFVILLVLIVLNGIFWGSRHFIVRNHVVYYEDLPEQFDGYRILQFSDLHTGTFRKGRDGDIRRIVNIINEQHCDMVVFTGDIVNRESSELEGLKDVLGNIQAPDGVYSIMGNHDYATYTKKDEQEQQEDIVQLLRIERSYGWVPLLNDHVRLYRGKESVVLAGVENWGKPPFPQYANLPKALKNVKKKDFIILLSHDPNHWMAQVVPNSTVQLTLSGHTHGGQFKIWGWSPVAWKYNEWSGLYKAGSQVLNVSEGLGGYIGPFRYGAWPEMSVITLRRM